MESDGDEASSQHPKWRKPTECVEFPSISMNDSIPILPSELITEILLRVQVKSLLKFRSVSKSWLSLISSSEFAKTHLISINNNKDQRHHRLLGRMYRQGLKDCSFRSLFCNPVTELSDLIHPTEDQCEDEFQIVGSVNGLICLAHGLYSAKHLFIWNPSIRKYKKLPNSEPELSYNPCIYGFGYDEFNDDYKIVGIFTIYGFSPYYEIRIYSLKDESWRKIHHLQDVMLFNRRSVFVKGKLHWASRMEIISFGLADENWGKVEQPCYGEGKSISALGVLGSDLCGFSHDLGIGVDVWIMKEYGLKESWTKMCSITYPRLNICLLYQSVFLSNNGDILVRFGSTFIIFNPKDGSFKYSKLINSDYWGMEELYIESLISPLSTETMCEKAQIKPT